MDEKKESKINPKLMKEGNRLEKRDTKREIRKTTNKIKETKSCFFETIKIHKHLARLPKEKRQKQLKIINESEGVNN